MMLSKFDSTPPNYHPSHRKFEIIFQKKNSNIQLNYGVDIMVVRIWQTNHPTSTEKHIIIGNNFCLQSLSKQRTHQSEKIFPPEIPQNWTIL